MKPLHSLILILALASPQISWAEDYLPIQRLEKEVLRLENDILALTRVIREQNKRIEALERQLSSDVTSPSPQPRAPSMSSSSPRGWHNSASWSRIKRGMSESQVVSTLGQPTAVDVIVSSHRTLFYRGEVDGSFVSGNVKLHEDRVWEVNEPVF